MFKTYQDKIKPKKIIVVKDSSGETHEFDAKEYEWFHKDGTCRIYNPVKRETLATFSNPIHVKLIDDANKT